MAANLKVLADQLSDNATWDDVMEEVRFCAVETGARAADLGEFATKEEIRTAFARWVSILQVKWTRPALADLIEAQAYIAQENPQAAEVIAQRIWDASQALSDNPHIGRRIPYRYA